MSTSNHETKDDLRAYRMGGLTILQWMGLLAIAGLAATWILQHFI